MSRRLLSILILLMFARPSFAGSAARYLLFEVDRQGEITKVGEDAVDVAGFAAPIDGTRATPPGAIRIDVVLSGVAGEPLYRTAVSVDRSVRVAESREDGFMACRTFERERTPFVLRVPAIGERIEMSVAGSPRIASFSVGDRSAASGRRGSGTRVHAEPFPHPGNRLDLLILGDGYTAADATKFDTDVARVAAQVFAMEPYRTYRDYVDITSLFVTSAQAGADHPVCSDGVDPLEGTFVDTAFDAQFCANEIHRLLIVNTTKVLQAAAEVPDWDQVLVIVNDAAYGGSGGSVMVVSTNGLAIGAVQHEFGHTFTGLADEYSTPYPGFFPCSDLTAPPCEPNVTDATDRSAIKWSPWIGAETPVPTPDADERVGLFPGARYLSVGMYRPQFWCLMNSLGNPFCHVCEQSFVLRLHEGWGGVPASGIDPIDAVTPQTGTLSVAEEATVRFEATLLEQNGNAPNVQWFVDGEAVSDATSPAFVLKVPKGTHQVELRVSDASAFVHPAMEHGALRSSRTWTVETRDFRKRRAVR